MTLDMEKFNVAMARNKYSVTDLAKVYGVSRARMNTILNSRKLTAVCVGRLAEALKCDVTEILKD